VPARRPAVPQDTAQEFVTRLRASAPALAAAAGAESAVVREVVPPARHRRSRCRVVLRSSGGAQTDLTFLGPVSSAAAAPDPVACITISFVMSPWTTIFPAMNASMAACGLASTKIDRAVS
jgi:hypothetical protein